MAHDLSNVLLQDYMQLDVSKKMTWKDYVRNALSFCFQKSKYLLLLYDTVILSLLVVVQPIVLVESNIISIAFLNVVWILLAYIRGVYAHVLVNDAEKVVGKTLKAWGMYVVVSFCTYFLLFSKVFESQQYFLILMLFGISLFVSRVLFLSIRKKYKYAIVKNRKVAIIGRNTYSNLLENYIKEGCSDYEVHQWYQPSDVNLNADNNTRSDLYNMREQGVNEIYCCLSAYNKEEVQQLINEADKYMIRVKFLPEFLNMINRNLKLETLGNIPVLTLRTEPLHYDRNKFLKRLFDIAFSLLVIVLLLSWLMPIIWLIIRIESAGPLFFKQQRSGIDNKPFACYKFRSMVANNGSADKVQATKKDKRITKVGAFLRKTSLDELPQFFNVLLGNMSIVGPRPHMISHTNQYSREVDAYMIRHYVKPGITGWAQVNGFRGETRELAAMQRRVECDIIYVESWTFLLDLKIIFLTAWNIIRGEDNAY